VRTPWRSACCPAPARSSADSRPRGSAAALPSARHHRRTGAGVVCPLTISDSPGFLRISGSFGSSTSVGFARAGMAPAARARGAGSGCGSGGFALVPAALGFLWHFDVGAEGDPGEAARGAGRRGNEALTMILEPHVRRVHGTVGIRARDAPRERAWHSGPGLCVVRRSDATPRRIYASSDAFLRHHAHHAQPSAALGRRICDARRQASRRGPAPTPDLGATPRLSPLAPAALPARLSRWRRTATLSLADYRNFLKVAATRDFSGRPLSALPSSDTGCASNPHRGEGFVPTRWRRYGSQSLMIRSRV